MTKTEHINVTNLANVRAAKKVFSDFLPMGDKEEAEWRGVMFAMSKIEDRLAKLVVKTE